LWGGKGGSWEDRKMGSWVVGRGLLGQSLVISHWSWGELESAVNPCKILIAKKINSSFEFFFKKWDNIYFQNEE
jgi:hypothetical protein